MKTKRNNTAKIGSLLLCFVLMFSSALFLTCFSAPKCFAEESQIEEENQIYDETAKKVNAAYDAAAAYIYSAVPNPDMGSMGGEWTIIGLSRGGYEVPDEYFADYRDRVLQYIKEKNGVLSERKYTEYSRVILALTAIGTNARDAGGYDIVEPLAETEKVTAQGINGAVFALIALGCGNYTADTTKEAEDFYLTKILNAEHSDGGWSFSTEEGTSDIDLTAMALQALSMHRDNSEAKSAIERGLAFLSENQLSDGGYASYGDECSESLAQVITALSALGIAPDDERFVKNGNTVVDALIDYMQPDGSFAHTLNGGGENLMASEQALYALAAQKRFFSGDNSLYDMTDVFQEYETSADDAGTIMMRLPVTDAGKTFADIADLKERAQIEALAERGIINGKSDSEFDPDGQLTRAEFAAIAVRILGIPESDEKAFDDVAADDWFYTFAASAKRYGIINGVSETEFNPNGNVTREEGACMIERCALFLGAKNDIGDAEIRDILSAFSDYTSISGWAKESLAFCFKEGIISDEEIEIKPSLPLTRAETAAMFYNLALGNDLIE